MGGMDPRWAAGAQSCPVPSGVSVMGIRGVNGLNLQDFGALHADADERFFWARWQRFQGRLHPF